MYLWKNISFTIKDVANIYVYSDIQLQLFNGEYLYFNA